MLLRVPSLPNIADARYRSATNRVTTAVTNRDQRVVACKISSRPRRLAIAVASNCQGLRPGFRLGPGFRPGLGLSRCTRRAYTGIECNGDGRSLAGLDRHIAGRELAQAWLATHNRDVDDVGTWIQGDVEHSMAIRCDRFHHL